MGIRLILLTLGLCALAQIEAYPVSVKKISHVLDKRQLASAPQIYYIPAQDGSIRYFQEISLSGYPLAQVQVPQVQQQQSKSGGNLFAILEKPVSATGNIIDKTEDVLTSVVDVPANLAKDLVQGVGLDNSVVGKVASGVVDTAAAVVKAPVQLVSNVAQVPFKAVSNLLNAFGG